MADAVLVTVEDVPLAFVCPICGHDGVDEEQCCSSCGADSYVVAKADAEDLGRRLKSLGHLEDLLAAWVAQKRAGHRFMTAEERALYDVGMGVVEKRKVLWPGVGEAKGDAAHGWPGGKPDTFGKGETERG